MAEDVEFEVTVVEGKVVLNVVDEDLLALSLEPGDARILGRTLIQQSWEAESD